MVDCFQTENAVCALIFEYKQEKRNDLVFVFTPEASQEQVHLVTTLEKLLIVVY